MARTPDECLDLLDGAEQVVAERFQTAGRLSAPGLATIELFGAIRGWCWAKGVPFESATPAQRYSHMRDASAALGGLIPRSEHARHEVDALAHLLAWEYRHATR